MYQQYFNFSELPFSISPDPHFMFMSERHQEGLAHLLYGINQGGGFVALTGEVGTGKTTLCHCLLQQLPENVDIALILNPKLTTQELLATICDELGISHAGFAAKQLIDAINQYLLAAYSQGRRTVLLIDEAQNLSLDVLEQIRLLTNLETSKAKLLQIILVGQPELNALLARQDLRQLNQRITARYHLLPLSLDETRAYIRHRLRVCKGNHRLFNPAAIRKIYQYSQGVPRLINILCDRALLGAYATNAREINPAIIRRAAQEVLGSVKTKRRWYSATAAILVIGAWAGLQFWSQPMPVVEPAKPAIAQQPVVPAAPIPAAKQVSFADQLDQAGLSFAEAVTESLNTWHLSAPPGRTADCATVATLGLQCLFGKGNWQELLTLNRPAILAFSDPTGAKRYVLLTGVEHDSAIIRLKDTVNIPLAELVTLWDGNYLLLWRPPHPGVTEIAPTQQSAAVLWLRERLSKITGKPAGDMASRIFDETLKAELSSFQRRHHLTPDGIAGARTLIHLDNQSGASAAPHLAITTR
ncbi:peptidoglycan-binding protein [Methylomonas sp. Kb3]|uniref:ExeA family protein n=1 Tax=Methylomonas sp. Kb3 TaxID=1611544 RepID=UPI000C339B11|nr:ExeA family protein [Methylomonas sp. Kb3]PKD38385.1 peptidoglycan-binding protein [Methylomonas sp. Kb3]